MPAKMNERMVEKKMEDFTRLREKLKIQNDNEEKRTIYMALGNEQFLTVEDLNKREIDLLIKIFKMK